MKTTALLALAAAGSLFMALAASPPAQAIPNVNLGIEKNTDALKHLARRGGGFRGGGGFAVDVLSVADVPFVGAVFVGAASTAPGATTVMLRTSGMATITMVAVAHG